MKKVLLLSLSLVMGLCAFAQQTAVKSVPAPVKAAFEKRNLGNEVVEGTANFEVRGTQSVVVNEGQEYYDAEAFYTTYDLQSNSVVANRMYQAKDGSVAVTATMSMSEFDPGFLDRGTGYNYARGGKVGKWGGASATRVEAKATGEDLRTGWPTIAPYGEKGEILINHGHKEGLSYYVRETAGQGKWDGPHAIPNPENVDEIVKGEGNTLSWARVVTTGENNNVVHVFANAAGDTNSASYYLRTENLKDWDIQFSPLEQDDLHINHYAADDYSVSANGENIAVLYCAGFSEHVMLYESNDGGLTWNSRMVWESPVVAVKDQWYDKENEDFLIEELYAPTQGSVAIGKDGVSHVVLGACMYDVKPGGYYSLYYGLLTDGVAYWNDTTCWEVEITEDVILTPKDTIEVEKEQYIYEDSIYVVDSALVDQVVYEDSIFVVDTIPGMEGAEDTYVYDTLAVAVDTIQVKEYDFDTLAVAVDTIQVKEFDYDTLAIVTDTTFVTVEEIVYDTTIVVDTVPVPSPIRSPYDNDLRNAMRLWWPTEDSTTMTLDFTNFCAITPPHPEEGFNGFQASMQYTGSDGNTAGDYLMAFGVCAYPTIAVDPAGNLAVAFSAPEVTRTWNGAFYMRSLYVNYKPVDTLYWAQMPVLAPTNLYSDFIHSMDECTFVSAVSTPVNENEFWFSCLSDETPGFYSGNTHSQSNITKSTVNVFKYNPAGELTDEGEEMGVNESIDVVYNIFPNPATDYINISSSMDANATVTFSNIAGQTVKVVNTNLTTGSNTIAVNDLTSGVYFCTVTANGYSHTTKVVVK